MIYPSGVRRWHTGKGSWSVLAWLMLWLIASRVQAATYYVTTSGNDGNPGSQAQPWLTIQKAANTVVAGDTVLVGGGTYSEKVTFTADGTVSSRIVFQNVSGQSPVIDGTGITVTAGDGLVVLNAVAYMDLNGFEVRDSGAEGVAVVGESHHLLLTNLQLRSNAASGLILNGPHTQPAFTRITNNEAQLNGRGGITLLWADGGYFLIEGNTVHDNVGTGNYDGIQVGSGSGGTHHVVVRNNTISNHGSANAGEDPLDLGGHGTLAHHYLVEGNTVSGSIGSIKMHSGSPNFGNYVAGSSGFSIFRRNRVTGLGWVSYHFPNPVALYHNIWANGGQVFFFYGDTCAGNVCSYGDKTFTGGDVGRLNWKNNIIWQEAASTAYAITWGGPSVIDFSYRSVRASTNLYKLASGQGITWNTATYGPPVDSAAFATYKAAASPDNPDVGSLLTTVATSAAFVNFAAQNYQPVAGSPVIDAGEALTTATSAGCLSTVLRLDRASYFFDGYCLGGECVGTPDTITIGAAAPVQVYRVEDQRNMLLLSQPRTWPIGAKVSLPYNGTAPDIGPFEFGG